MLRAELGREVVPHDDGSRDGMYDLQIQGAEGIEPVEVKSVLDETELKQFEAFRAQGPVLLPGEGSWQVGVAPCVRLRNAEKALGDKLRAAERCARDRSPGRLRRQAELIRDATHADGVVWVHPLERAQPGFVLLQAGWAGCVVPSEEALLSLVTGAARRWDRVLKRLCQVEAARRHLAIVTRFGTDMAVQSLLEDPDVVPVTAPDVPSGLTDLWVVGGVAGQGSLHWSRRAAWSRVSPEAVNSAWASEDSFGRA